MPSGKKWTHRSITTEEKQTNQMQVQETVQRNVGQAKSGEAWMRWNDFLQLTRTTNPVPEYRCLFFEILRLH